MATQPAEPTTPISTRTTWLSGWADVGVLLVLIPVALAAIRLMFVSGGDQVVLKTLLRTLDVPAIVLGTVLPSATVLLFLALQPLTSDPGLVERTFGGGQRSRLVRRGLVALLLVTYLALGQWPASLWLPIGVVVASVLALAIRLVVTIRSTPKKSRQLRAMWKEANDFAYVPMGGWTRVLIGLVFFTFVVFSLGRGLWLPQENIELGGSGKPISGFVLQVDDGWTTVLTDQHRVVIVRSETVTDRQACGQGRFESLWTILFNSRAAVNVACTDD